MITLREYIEKLQELAKQNPNLKDLPIIYSRDDEGNQFQKVVYTAVPGHIDKVGEFRNENETSKKTNCVCIN